jgi:hypothetical protein
MTYPMLEAAKAFALVEVRKGHGAASWDNLAQVYRGPCDEDDHWTGGEGEKLSVRHCQWDTDPNSGLSLPYTVTGMAGLGTGQPELLRFPSGV